jgi:hypothetical protein
MRTHHTKTKGDLGVMAAAYDLTKKGFIVCFPMTEHAPFDLIAYAGGQSLRVQVKYRTLSRGCVSVQFVAVWSDRHGVHRQRVDKEEIDLVCIYSPDTERCYYVDPNACAQSISLRVVPAANCQSMDVRPADEFLDIPERLRRARQDSNLRRST